VAQAAKVRDSLTVLPLVRLEAAAWRAAAVGYRSAHDSLRRADAGHRAAYQSEQQATAGLGNLLANSETVADAWKGKARKRGLLNALLLAALGGVGYFTLTR
jgi:hypothetical protein